jgi:hypothetical protein
MKKSIFGLSAFFVVLSTIFLGCDNPGKNVKNAYEGTIKESAVISHADQIYLADIEKYTKETEKIIDSNSQIISGYRAKTETKNGKVKYDYRQSILKLELQNSYMKMKLGQYEPEGQEKWEIFKAEFAFQLVELSKEFAGFSERN